ncbi:13951_t:CDS:1, partial [Racocetra fulgida]
MLRGNFNEEYLELSWKARRQRRHERRRVYSPFWQNETHIKRLRNQFSLSEPNILSVVVFNSPQLGYDFKRNKKLILKEKFTLANNSIGGGIADILTRHERQDTQLTCFEKLRARIIKEITGPNEEVKGKIEGREEKNDNLSLLARVDDSL